MSEGKVGMTTAVEVDYGQPGDAPFTYSGIEKLIAAAIKAGECPRPEGDCPIEGEIGQIYNGGMPVEDSDTLVSFVCQNCVEPQRVIEVGRNFARLYTAAADGIAEGVERAITSAQERPDTPLDGGFGFDFER